MTRLDAFEPATEAHAQLDRDARLVFAEPALDALNRAAGGATGDPLALPGLAAIVRLAARLGTPLSRQVTVADGEDQVSLWATARPSGDGVQLTVSDWTVSTAPMVPNQSGSTGVNDPSALSWECDAALRLTRLRSGTEPGLVIAVADLIGHPLAALLPLYDPRREASNKFTLAPTGADVRVTAEALRRGDGAIVGFRGSAALALDGPASVPAGPALPPAFTAGLDRALRRPLAQIVANADSIAQATDGPIAPDYADYAADIAGAGRHLLALVDDLVDLEAIERPGFALRPEPIDLADVARRAAGLLTVRAEAADVSISRPVGEASVPAFGDFRRALQIVVNLVTNAVRYAPPGSAVVVAVAERGGRALLSVTDRGKGIAAIDQARVFAKFERVDPSEPGGNGLGLYIARRLARAMGGDLSLESAAGEGARFTLSLPAG